MNELTAIMAAYVLTFLVASGSILEPVRVWSLRFTWLAPKVGKPFLYCRMCCGFWLSLLVAWHFNVNFFMIYGASYFLATQER